MAENKKSVLLYCDIIHTVKELTDEEAGKLFKHYLEYINDLNPTAPDKLTQVVFEPIKQNLKRDLIKWQNQLNQRSDAGKKGMEKRWNNKNNETITNDNTVIKNITNHNSVKNDITNITVKDTVTVTDTVNVTVKVKDTVIKSIEQRKSEFSLTLNPYLESLTKEYGLVLAKDILNDFYKHWTQTNEGGKKFLREKQTTWDLSRRLDTWIKNEKTFTNGKLKNYGNQQTSKKESLLTSIAENRNKAHDLIDLKYGNSDSNNNQ